jgi:hypothetical protein
MKLRMHEYVFYSKPNWFDRWTMWLKDGDKVYWGMAQELEAFDEKTKKWKALPVIVTEEEV